MIWSTYAQGIIVWSPDVQDNISTCDIVIINEHTSCLQMFTILIVPMLLLLKTKDNLSTAVQDIISTCCYYEQMFRCSYY